MNKWLVRTGTLSAGVLLVAALLAIVNYFGWKYHKRFDWTASRLYTLSDKSKNVVRDLKRDVEFVVFVPPQDELYEPVREILSQYDAASPRIAVRMVDAERNPAEAERLIQQYGVASTGVAVVSGNDRRFIASGELAEMDFSALQLGQAPSVSGFKGEQLFTGALLQLGEGRKPKVLLTTGHGERSLDDQGNGGLASIQALLGSDNFELEEWASLGKPSVPPGTDLIVIAGPNATFLPPELNALTAYVNAGGRMLVLLDPVVNQTGGSGLVSTGLEGWLARYGARAGGNIVLDPPNAIPAFGPETLFSSAYGDHPVTNALSQARLPVLFSLVRSVGRGEAAGFTVTELLRTSDQGWGETSLGQLDDVRRDDADIAGPVPLGVAIEGGGSQGRKARLVVFGDSNFATNQLVTGNEPNAILLSNALNWLTEREALLAIPPKKTEQVRLNLTGSQFRTVYVLTLAVLPALAVAIGAVVRSRRRR